jgi:hypothetical protein
MTKKGESTRKQILRDIESYTSGETPSPLDMMRAARLDHWHTEIRRRGKEFVMVIRGEVSRHPEVPDGTPISTPAVVWRDRKDRFVRTHKRMYVLGDPIGREIPVVGLDT